MPFIKGQSGNPGGRAKIKLADGLTISELARKHTVEALEALVGILNNPTASDSAKLSAATLILDRGWGRPLDCEKLERSRKDKSQETARAAIYHATGVPVDQIPDEMVEAKAAHLAVRSMLRKDLDS